MIRIILLSIFFFSVLQLFCQISEEEMLAKQYFQNGAYEKAAVIYEKLYKHNPTSLSIYKSYYETLLAIKNYPETEKLVRKQIKKNTGNSTLYVDLGNVFFVQGQLDKAHSQFDMAISSLPFDESQIILLANSFSSIKEYDYAIKSYLQGRKIFRYDKMFSYELARLYESVNDVSNMIASYLDFSEGNPSQVQLVKNALQGIMEDEKSYKELQSQLYKRIQYNETLLFSDLLTWIFIQKKDYDQAFIQVRALDKRFKENGSRLINLAQLALNDTIYDAAIKCYQYLIDLGKENIFYLQARIELLRSKKAKIINTTEYTESDLIALEKDYQNFLNEYGKTAATLTITRELANLYAFYLHDLNKAIQLLEESIALPNTGRLVRANCKLDLGDYYLMNGDLWEPVLLYGQVDKEFKEDFMGEEARFRNAKLSYYKGEFEWAQAQMDVLKSSTSELIANDALNLSVFIQENLGVDSLLEPMAMFAKADLLRFQNKDAEAIIVLDSLSSQYPLHSLGDDVLFARAQIMIKKKKYEEAEKLLEDLVKQFSDEVLADDALFKIAELNEKKLNNLEKAKEYYQKIITDYNGSLYVVEARKKFRKLRGDSVN